MPARKDITIRFCLNKSEGELIELSKFSEEEIADVRKCLALVLTYVPAGEPFPKIISVQIIHDGITPVEDEIEGYFIDRECDYPLDGYPTPVVRFLLDRAMDEQEFLQCVFETSFCVRTESMEENDEESYFAEDHNGYSSILTKKERENLIIFLERNQAYCGKTFLFPNGLPDGGYSIPACDFVLQPSCG